MMASRRASSAVFIRVLHIRSDFRKNIKRRSSGSKAFNQFQEIEKDSAKFDWEGRFGMRSRDYLPEVEDDSLLYKLGMWLNLWAGLKRQAEHGEIAVWAEVENEEKKGFQLKPKEYFSLIFSNYNVQLFECFNLLLSS